MGSSRLPGKVLAEVGGRPMLEFLLARLRPLGARVVVATSDLPGDDPVAECAEAAGVPVVRADEQDVLGRFLAAVEAHPASTVIRITGDCPLTDPAVVADVVALRRRRGADYATNVLPRTFPKGLDVEVCRTAALRAAGESATDPAEREHVTPFLYRHPERFVLANLRSGERLGDERWTVDTSEDLEFVRDLVDRLENPLTAGWREILAVAGRRYRPPRGAVHLRPADEGDRDRVLAWRNDPDTVRFSLTGSAVTPGEHARWYARRLEDPATRLSIAELDGEPIGSVRVDVVDAVGTVSIAVDPAHRGRGLGTAMLRRLVETTRGDVGLIRLVAEVVPGNEASCRAFAAAGFVEQPHARAEDPLRFVWENPLR
jgi:spore coat polysaccharide biosynthesis protein SpsF